MSIPAKGRDKDPPTRPTLLPENRSAMTRLAGREREVLQFIAEGLNSGEIAGRLKISTNTVDTHRRNLMKKFNLHSIAVLTRYAIREGLTDIDR